MSKDLHPEDEGKGPSPEEKKRLSRRAFLALGVTGFALVAASPLVVEHYRRRRDRGLAGGPLEAKKAASGKDTVFIKNPAFQKMGRVEGRAVLKTRTTDGKEMAFEVDEWGEAAWDLALNVEEYQKGKRLDSGSILAALEKRRGGDDLIQFRKDFHEFVEAARRANLLMDSDQFVWSVFNEA